MKGSLSRSAMNGRGPIRVAVLALTIMLVSVTSARVARGTQPQPIAPAIHTVLANLESTVRFRSPEHGARHALGTLYARRADQPLWSVNGRPTPQALALIGILKDAGDYGLSPRDYGGNALAALAHRIEVAPVETRGGARLRARFDVELSVQTLRLICDLHYGRVGARAAGFELQRPRRALDLDDAVRSLARSGNPGRALALVEPNFYPYRLLEHALAQYRRLASEESSLTVLPRLPQRSVKPGQAYRGAPQLRRLLRVLGDLPATADAGGDATDSEYLDPRLVYALEHFQRRHGLAVDGVLGAATFRQLTTPFEVRVRQIELNLERLRWLPALHAPLIIVNIPQFQLYALRTTKRYAPDTLQMAVIVGRTKRGAHTPMFIADMKYVVFRPYWNVPRNITVREMLPQLRAKPGMLAAQHLQIVRGESDEARVVAPTPENLAALAAGRLRLRQLPGPANALGLIKFVLPNRFSVFLHSTPARRLFRARRRAFSHGCVRVSNPVALAVFVLRGTPGEWSPERIDAAMNGADDQRVPLARPVRVMFLYQTVFATDGEQILFFDDLYGRDPRLEHLLRLSAVTGSADRRSARPVNRSHATARQWTIQLRMAPESVRWGGLGGTPRGGCRTPRARS